MTTQTRLKLPQPNDPVSEPIINSPYGLPEWRWQLDSSTKAYAPALPGRRESQNIPPVAGSRKLRGKHSFPGEMGVRWAKAYRFAYFSMGGSAVGAAHLELYRPLAATYPTREYG